MSKEALQVHKVKLQKVDLCFLRPETFWPPSHHPQARTPMGGQRGAAWSGKTMATFLRS